jgi:integrase
LHFHDLRHAGNTLTAATGATLRELMDRTGHSTARAALIYQHGSHARQHEIADALGQLARQQMTDSPRTKQGQAQQAYGHGTGTA